ncbi:hypothetical protein BDV35DRAFT_28405 [Aspergillus flavus]|uniref:Uncharacterized protein n=1 Tax=Aspergillus flavus TaxID=5059 RepID=A0A5N6GLT6_ASPFL|nr:hypothetical protein BDV35DRAFT_28405 [Aspergillus flavus]
MALTTATQRCRSNQWLVGWNAQKFDSGADRYKNFFLFFFQEFLRGLSPSPPLASRRHITVFVTSVCATTKTQTATLVDKSWNEPMPYVCHPPNGDRRFILWRRPHLLLIGPSLPVLLLCFCSLLKLHDGL